MKASDVTFESKPSCVGIKSPMFWTKTARGGISPLAYIRKAKHVPQEDFDRFIEALSFRLDAGVLEGR